MSWEVTTHVLRNVPVAGNAKVILLGIANHAHPDGTNAYPAIDTLALYACVSRRTVQRSIHQLEVDGWIERDGWGPAGQKRWRVRLEAASGDDKLSPPGDMGDDTAVAWGMTPVSPEPSLEPSKGVANATPVDEVFFAWVIATDRDRSKTKLTTDRRRRIKRALSSHGLEDCLIAVRHIGADAWARGQNDRGQRFDDIEHALGTPERIERWRDAVPRRSASSPQPVVTIEPGAAENARRLWERVAPFVKEEVDETQWAIWIAPLVPVDAQGDRLTLGAPQALASWVRERFAPHLQRCAREVLGRPITLEVVVVSEEQAA